MRRNAKVMAAISVIPILILQFSVLYQSNNNAKDFTFINRFFLSPTAIATSSSRPSSTNGIDPAIIVALITSAAAIISALVTALFAWHNARRERQAVERERKLKEEQEKERKEYEVKLKEEQEKERKEYEVKLREMEQLAMQKEQAIILQNKERLLFLQNELKTKYAEIERVRKVIASDAETLRLKMLRSLTNPERADAYRQALCANPDISKLQILNMDRPLDIRGVYVRLRLYQGAQLDSDLESSLLSADDPNDLQQALFNRLERRVIGAIEPDEAIRTYSRCVLIGDPGAGKTTLLKYLALSSSFNQLKGLPDLPILIGLNAFASSVYDDLFDFAADQWEKDYGFAKIDARIHMDELAREGNILLLLDALDETVIGSSSDEAESSYTRVINSIKQLVKRYPRIYIVVTARKAGYQKREQLVGFTRLEVLDFRREDIRQFITNWFNSYNDPQKVALANDLNARLERNLHLQGLVSNPLLLSLTAIVYETRRYLPDRRAMLYEYCVDTLLNRWDASRGLERYHKFEPKDKYLLLKEIAWHFHLQGQRYFLEEDLLAVIANFLPKINLLPTQNKQILIEITGLHGLLKEQAPSLQGFLHLTLQEYFVALYAKDKQQLRVLLEHRYDPWWQEVLLLYAGLTDDASPLLLKMLDNNQGTFTDDLFMSDLILVGQCLATHPTLVEVSLWKRGFTLLFDALIKTPYSLIQERIAEALASIGDTQVNEHLLQLLSNDQIDEAKRRCIANALGHSGDVSVASSLIQLLSQKGMKPILGRSIALALGNIGNRSVVSRLLQLLLQDDIDRSVRGSIAEALGNLEDRSIVPTLMNMLPDETLDGYIRGSLAEAAGILGDSLIVVDLVRMLFDKKIDGYVRGRVASALGMLKDSSVIPQLIQRLTEQDEPFVLQSIALALGKFAEDQVASNLINLLAEKSIDSHVRGSITTALGNLKMRSIIPDLIRMLYSEHDEYMRGSIALALGNLGEHLVTPDLLQFLSMKQLDIFTRENIAFTLGSLGDQMQVPEMIEMLHEEQNDEYVRGGMVLALSNLGVKSIVPELVQLLVSANTQGTYLRQCIVEAIGRLANAEETIRELLPLLEISHTSDAVHRTLWAVSRRASVRIFISSDQQKKKIKIIKY